MGLPLLALAPLISGAAGVAQAGIGAASSILTNRANRRFAVSMRDYDNTYNSPVEQMKRLKAAGLNPAMMYGGNNAQVASSGKAPQGEAPQFEIGGIVNNVLQSMLLMAETNNKKAELDLIKTKQQGANLGNVMTDLKISEQDTKNRILPSMLDESLTGLRYKNQLTFAQTTATLDANQRAAALQAPTLQQAALKVLYMELQNKKSIAETTQIEAAIKKIQADTELTNYENKWNEKFVGKNSREWLSAVMGIIKMFK